MSTTGTIKFNKLAMSRIIMQKNDIKRLIFYAYY
jgi:hypothetical protein